MSKPNLSMPLALGLLTCCGSVAAAPVLDQEQAIINSAEATLGTSIPGRSTGVGQTFSVGIGGYLTIVEFALSNAYGFTGQVTLNIVDLSSGAPGGAVLGSVSVNAADLPTARPTASQYTSFDFGTGVAVTAGTQLGLTIIDGGTFPTISAHGDGLSSYVDGSGWLYNSSTGWSSWSPDFGFRTYVEATPVVEPEPAAVANPTTLLLLSMGLAGLALVSRQRMSGDTR